MAYPTGSGSELLYRGTIHALSNTGSSFRFDNGSIGTAGTSSYVVPANHIITILSIIFTEEGNSASRIKMYVSDGSSGLYFLDHQDIGARGTFIWNDKFVLVGGDKVVVSLADAGNTDVYFSFIDQDWS